MALFMFIWHASAGSKPRDKSMACTPWNIKNRRCFQITPAPHPLPPARTQRCFGDCRRFLTGSTPGWQGGGLSVLWVCTLTWPRRKSVPCVCLTKWRRPDWERVAARVSCSGANMSDDLNNRGPQDGPAQSLMSLTSFATGPRAWRDQTATARSGSSRWVSASAVRTHLGKQSGRHTCRPDFHSDAKCQDSLKNAAKSATFAR